MSLILLPGSRLFIASTNSYLSFYSVINHLVKSVGKVGIKTYLTSNYYHQFNEVMPMLGAPIYHLHERERQGLYAY